MDVLSLLPLSNASDTSLQSPFLPYGIINPVSTKWLTRYYLTNRMHHSVTLVRLQRGYLGVVMCFRIAPHAILRLRGS